MLRNYLASKHPGDISYFFVFSLNLNVPNPDNSKSLKAESQSKYFSLFLPPPLWLCFSEVSFHLAEVWNLLKVSLKGNSPVLSVFPNTRKHTQQQEHFFFPIFHFPGSNPKLRPRLADLHLQRIDTTTTAFTFALFQPFTGDRDRPTSCTFTLSFLEQTRWILASSSNKSGGAHWKGRHSQTRTWGTAKSTAPESEGCVTPELLITLETQHWCPSPTPPNHCIKHHSVQHFTLFHIWPTGAGCYSLCCQQRPGNLPQLAHSLPPTKHAGVNTARFGGLTGLYVAP